MGKKIIRILFIIAVVAFLAGMVTNERSWVQETEKSTPANGGDGWRFLIAPYIWLTAIQGNAEENGNKVDIDVGLRDAISLINKIKFIFMS
jgi:flagellar basal body-associated protein FliL